MTTTPTQTSQTGNKVSRTIISIAAAVYTVILCTFSGVEDLTYISLATVNTVICAWHMFSIRIGEYTLSKFINLFILVFFVMANAIQYGDDNLTLTFVLTFTEEDYQAFQLTVLGILILYNTLYYHWSRKPGSNNWFNSSSDTLKISPWKLVTISLISGIAVMAFFKFNPSLLFLRGYLDEYAGFNYENDTTSYLLFDKIIRPMPICCFIIALITNTAPRLRIFLFIMALLTEFPLGVARNSAAIYWLPVMIIIFERLLKKNRVMWMMIVGLFIVFPALDITRYKDIKTEENQIGMSYLNTMNYDASQLFMAAIKTEEITYGNQLVGTLFFFIPRSAWTDKPTGSGHYITEKNNAVFNNVSMPFFAEGYMNFGWGGMLLFTVALSFLTAKIDTSFWKAKRGKTRSYRAGYYLFLLGSIIFIMRGDLMSSYAYTVGTIGSYFLTYIIVKKPAPLKR